MSPSSASASATADCTDGASATVALSATCTLISTCGSVCIGAANVASVERVCAIRAIRRNPVAIAVSGGAQRRHHDVAGLLAAEGVTPARSSSRT